MGSQRVGYDFACVYWTVTSSNFKGKLEKEMATHSSVLAWRIPGTGEPGGLLSLGSHRVRHDWSDLAAAAAEWLRFGEDVEKLESFYTACEKVKFCRHFGKHCTISQSALHHLLQTNSQIWINFKSKWIKTSIICTPVFTLLLLLLSHFSRVRLCVTPQTAAHQAPPSLGFFRQADWTGLPFPSPFTHYTPEK